MGRWTVSDGPPGIWRCLVPALLPFGALRLLAYRWLCGYRLGRGSRIGWATVIQAREVHLARNVHIGFANRLVGLDSLVIGEDCTIGSLNLLAGMRRLELGAGSHVGSQLSAVGPSWAKERADLITGRKCIITGKHHFDVYADIVLGDRVTVGGVYSSFWTHGPKKVRNGAIRIGDGCYLGAGVHVGPSVELPPDTLVAMGAVVVSSPERPGCTLGGVPARILSEEGMGK